MIEAVFADGGFEDFILDVGPEDVVSARHFEGVCEGMHSPDSAFDDRHLEAGSRRRKECW